mmetsp:Transcript_92885/g.278620  ORF Transcript_92885/g.278620 Transcript_92885/m.278620 type:complete len:268 (+) Transcript_92885:1272-2075(+)
MFFEVCRSQEADGSVVEDHSQVIWHRQQVERGCCNVCVGPLVNNSCEKEKIERRRAVVKVESFCHHGNQHVDQHHHSDEHECIHERSAHDRLRGSAIAIRLAILCEHRLHQREQTSVPLIECLIIVVARGHLPQEIPIGNPGGVPVQHEHAGRESQQHDHKHNKEVHEVSTHAHQHEHHRPKLLRHLQWPHETRPLQQHRNRIHFASGGSSSVSRVLSVVSNQDEEGRHGEHVRWKLDKNIERVAQIGFDVSLHDLHELIAQSGEGM